MAMMSFSEVLLLLAVSYGASTTDLVSLIEVDDYFNAPKMEQMLEIAGQAPKDGKDQIKQLLAIRWLGASAEGKKSEPAKKLLEEIAKGDKGQDRSGFAKEYAARALGGKGQGIPPKSVSDDAIKWFPAEATLCGGFDLRVSTQEKPGDEAMLRKVLARTLPPQAKEEIHKFAEAVGNLRLDRVSFALQMDSKRPNPERIFVRFTGLGDPKRLADFLGKQVRGATVTNTKGPKGEAITLISSENTPPGFALIGDTDLIMAGFEKNRAPHLEVLEQALKTRADNKASAATGPLTGMLRQVPAQAYGLFAGEMTEPLLKQLTAGNSPFRTFPTKLTVDLTRDKEIKISLNAALKDIDEAKLFIQSLEDLKKQGLALVENAPPPIKIPDDTRTLLTKTLNTLKLEAKEGNVTGSLSISKEVLEAVRELFEKNVPR